jgi:hypothetical protein
MDLEGWHVRLVVEIVMGKSAPTGTGAVSARKHPLAQPWAAFKLARVDRARGARGPLTLRLAGRRNVD